MSSRITFWQALGLLVLTRILFARGARAVPRQAVGSRRKRAAYASTNMTTFSVAGMFARDFERYEGVRPIQIYLMRLGFLLVIVLMNPLRWIPLVLFEIAYKSIWLVVVAYPAESSVAQADVSGF
jgi:hypothetical protein